jgi:hypothetical protein
MQECFVQLIKRHVLIQESLIENRYSLDHWWKQGQLINDYFIFLRTQYKGSKDYMGLLGCPTLHANFFASNEFKKLV